MTDSELLDELRKRMIQQTICFITVDEINQLRQLTHSLPIVVPTTDKRRYAIQATALSDQLNIGRQTLTQRVKQQLLK